MAAATSAAPSTDVAVSLVDREVACEFCTAVPQVPQNRVDGEIASPHPAQALGGSGAVANPHSEQNEPADNELHLGQIIL
jgi:hypothetical protein